MEKEVLIYLNDNVDCSKLIVALKQLGFNYKTIEKISDFNENIKIETKQVVITSMGMEGVRDYNFKGTVVFYIFDEYLNNVDVSSQYILLSLNDIDEIRIYLSIKLNIDIGSKYIRGLVNIIYSLSMFEDRLDQLIKSCDNETFGQALVSFCGSWCGNATTSLTTGKKIEFVNIIKTNDNGTFTYCKKDRKCHLQAFVKYIKEERPDCFNENVYGYFKAKEVVSETNLVSLLSKMKENIFKELNNLLKLKKKYCVEKCDQVSNDINLEKGDTLISNMSEIMNNKCYHCHVEGCSLNTFFNLLSYKIT